MAKKRMAKKPKPPPLPPEAEPFVRDMMGILSSPPVAKVLFEGDPIENLEHLRRPHAMALFRRIENQSAIFTEADREELMDLASKATVGGMMAEAIQRGIRLGEENHKKAKTARDGNSENAAKWRARADELEAEKRAANPKLSASQIGERIQPKLQAEFPGARLVVGTVQKYLLSKKKVRTSS